MVNMGGGGGGGGGGGRGSSKTSILRLVIWITNDVQNVLKYRLGRGLILHPALRLT